MSIGKLYTKCYVIITDRCEIMFELWELGKYFNEIFAILISKLVSLFLFIFLPLPWGQWLFYDFHECLHNIVINNEGTKKSVLYLFIILFYQFSKYWQFSQQMNNEVFLYSFIEAAVGVELRVCLAVHISKPVSLTPLTKSHSPRHPEFCPDIVCQFRWPELGPCQYENPIIYFLLLTCLK